MVIACIKVSETIYDLENDPKEKKNVIDVAPEKAEEMKKMLSELQSLGLDSTSNIMSKEEREETARRLRELGYL
jgi:hypothetical protein